MQHERSLFENLLFFLGWVGSIGVVANSGKAAFLPPNPRTGGLYIRRVRQGFKDDESQGFERLVV